jgi:hypothetical protein
MLRKIPQHFLKKFVIKYSWGFFGVVFPYLDWPLAAGLTFYLNKLQEEV